MVRVFFPLLTIKKPTEIPFLKHRSECIFNHDSTIVTSLPIVDHRVEHIFVMLALFLSEFEIY